MADTTKFRNGFTMRLDGGLFSIVEFQHVKPGKGGAFVRTRLKNLSTGSVIDRTFRSRRQGGRDPPREAGDAVPLLGYGHLPLHGSETYEQVGLDADLLADSAGLLQENETAYVMVVEGKPIGVELPNFVQLKVTHTEPGVKGRYRHRGGQAGHPRDRGRGLGAPVRQSGGHAEDRHPHRRLRRAGLLEQEAPPLLPESGHWNTISGNPATPARRPVTL